VPSGAVSVEGDERAAAVILRAGRKAQDQSSTLQSAADSPGVAAPGDWTNRTGKLSASLARTIPEAEADRLRLVSDVPYARFVWYGTRRQEARPPQVNEDALVGAVSRRVARDLISP